MVVKDDISLRDYLHLLSKRVKDPPCIEVYDEFLIKVWDFFALRVAAESYFDSHKYVAYSRRGALPLPWRVIGTAWEGGPPEQTITLIAKRNYNDVNSLISNLRKVLVRVRQKVALGRVQQLDSHCLRWLTRQPGYTAAEKGGSKQEILGVVRVENYNTLENRVFKDFLSRCLALATMYLRKYDDPKNKVVHEHVNVKSVSRFKNLCIAGLAIPEFEKVVELHEVPQPNYVLQQDRLYSKIWRSYGDIIRQEDVAEKLWDRRNEIDDLYAKCRSEVDLQCSVRAKYDTPLWICELDGKRPIFENPIWGNELAPCDILQPEVPQEETQVIDFTYPWDGRDFLIYPAAHRNARPFIQNPHRPSQEPGEKVPIAEIIWKKDAAKLGDYFRQLHGLLGGKRWIILTPDDWETNWLETVKRSRPSSFTRENAFLLWRSVAAALGKMEERDFRIGESLVVADGYSVSQYNATEIRFMGESGTNRILPQRSSARLHADSTPDCQDVRFYLEKSFRDQAPANKLGKRNSERICTGRLSVANFISSEAVSYSKEDKLLHRGVERYLREESKGLVSYFDELDALSLVVQSRAEEVVFQPLVKHNECSPGGKAYYGEKTKGGSLLEGAAKVSLNLLEGELRDDAPLKTLDKELDDKVPETQEIYFQAEMIPGQGLATVTFYAEFLERPLPLDLTTMKDEGLTKARIEREMKRHFPPVMPFVEASEAIWDSVKYDVVRYRRNSSLPTIRGRPDTGLFYHPQPYWDFDDQPEQNLFRNWGENRRFDPDRMSPVDLLKRENVFGNAPGHEFPTNDFDWTSLFRQLANDYRNGRDVLRLIAWTYQYKNEEFEFIRDRLYSDYVRYFQTLSIVEYSFCANCFGSGDERVAGILGRVIERIAGGAASENELRLTYNLLQFHPEAVEHVSSDLCERAFMRIYRKYNTEHFIGPDGYLAGAQATKIVGYCLKCMLFLLHRRRFDPQFLYRDENWKPSGFLACSIPVRCFANGKEYPAQRAHEQLRVSFINYVRGHGTIEGIPLGD